MPDSNDEVYHPILNNGLAHPIRDAGELEEILETAFELIDSLDFHQAIERHGYIVLACVFAQLADELARYDYDEEKRTAIARLGRDRKYEKAEELFNIFATPRQIAMENVKSS